VKAYNAWAQGKDTCESRIPLTLNKIPFTNPNYLQSRFQYIGPVSKNTVKIEVSKEKFVGDVLQKEVAQAFDCPRFTVHVYEACILFEPNSIRGSAEESNSDDCFGSSYKF
jgi:hypothetical protein